jgi:hypothetical protein
LHTARRDNNAPSTALTLQSARPLKYSSKKYFDCTVFFRMTDLGSHRRHYPYEIVEQSLDVELPPHSLNKISMQSRRRTFILFFISIFIFTMPFALWRKFHFSLPLPDFPFMLGGNRAPTCVLQPLLYAARLVLIV